MNAVFSQGPSGGHLEHDCKSLCCSTELFQQKSCWSTHPWSCQRCSMEIRIRNYALTKQSHPILSELTAVTLHDLHNLGFCWDKGHCAANKMALSVEHEHKWLEMRQLYRAVLACFTFLMSNGIKWHRFKAVSVYSFYGFLFNGVLIFLGQSTFHRL